MEENICNRHTRERTITPNIQRNLKTQQIKQTTWLKNEAKASLKETHRGQIRICSSPSTARELQVKLTRRCGRHPLKQPRFGTLAAPNAARIWSNRSPYSLLVEMQNDIATLEDSLVVSYKAKHRLIIWFSNHAPRYLAKGVENLCSHKKPAYRCLLELYS